MEMIRVDEPKKPAMDIENFVLREQKFKNRIAKSFLDIAGAGVGIFLAIAVILITTTDIHISSFEDFAGFTLEFFLLLFCTYSMYVNSTDSGMRAALKTDTYKAQHEVFIKAKGEIIAAKLQARLPEFCHHYIVTELYNSRNAVLAIIGFPYEEYEEKYLGKSDEEIEKCEALTHGQKKAVIKANAIEPLKLTPEMIMKRGRKSGRRDPLGTTPESKKTANLIFRFFSTFFTSIIASMIVLDAVTDPSWGVFVECVVKLMAIIMNGVLGYRFGYENILIDTVEYMNDQAELLREANEYLNT